MLPFWFDFGSTYSYVGPLRVRAECVRGGVHLEHRPFLVGPIFTELLGIKDSPLNAQPVRGKYMWRDRERLCGKHGLPWRRPTVFPRSSVLAARVALSSLAVIGPLTRAIFLANFAEDLDISDAGILRKLVDSAGGDGERALALAQTPEIKARLRANTT